MFSGAIYVYFCGEQIRQEYLAGLHDRRAPDLSCDWKKGSIELNWEELKQTINGRGHPRLLVRIPLEPE
jgi:hypothetical protein